MAAPTAPPCWASAPPAPATVAPAASARPWTSVRREIMDCGSRCTSRVITSSQDMRRPVDPAKRVQGYSGPASVASYFRCSPGLKDAVQDGFTSFISVHRKATARRAGRRDAGAPLVRSQIRRSSIRRRITRQVCLPRGSASSFQWSLRSGPASLQRGLAPASRLPNPRFQPVRHWIHVRRLRIKGDEAQQARDHQSDRDRDRPIIMCTLGDIMAQDFSWHVSLPRWIGCL